MDNTLSRRLPDILKPFEELRQIMDTESKETVQLWRESAQTLENLFFMSANEKGIALYEDMIGIKPLPGQTLEERKFAILVKYQESRPYSVTFLKNQLDTLCKGDYWLELHPESYYIKILLALTSKHNLSAVKEMVGRMLPANMLRDIDLKYNQHETFRGKRYKELAAYTHFELRNEVL